MDRKQFLLVKIMSRQRARAIIGAFNKGMQPAQQPAQTQQPGQPMPPDVKQMEEANMQEGENGNPTLPSNV